jgi:hypothetical protein
MENSQHAKYTKIMLLGLAGVLLLASVIGFFVSRRLPSDQNSGATKTYIAPSIVPTLIPYPVKGLFVLREQNGAQSVQQGQPIVIDVLATSSKDTVAGYDVIFSYDKTVFERQSVQNKNNSFRIFTFDRSNHLSISATKNLSVTEPIRFTDTPLLSFTFVAKKKGTYVFSLKPVANESSKLVNESAQVTYPESQDFRLEIK